MTIKVRSTPRNRSSISAITRTACLLIALVIFFALSNGLGFAQTGQQELPSPVGKSPVSLSPPEKLQAKAEASDGDESIGVGAARIKLLADARRLTALSRALQAERAKSTPDTLSLNMVKKAEEIQKLAAMVKVEIAKLP